MRGEHLSGFVSTVVVSGSSPHARGTRHAHLPRVDRHRFIPACAGNTSRRRARSLFPTVHPRMRGEHDSERDHAHAHAGSSPHARGTRHSRRRGAHPRRFIPACAGNTQAYSPSATASTVHPRMRGEHLSARRTICASDGSSPHARGTHTSAALEWDRKRFIPACAGNTADRRTWATCFGGSSPHARGTRRTAAHGPRALAVHPRMRGEHQPDPQPDS